MRVTWIAAALLTLAVASDAGAQAARVLVMPFENITREGRIFWLGEASAVLLGDDLNALGTSVITREERREAFDRLQVPAAAVLTDATVIRLGRALLRDKKVPPALWAKTVELFGRQGAVEITAIIGDYVMAGIMLTAVDQQLPPGREALLPVPGLKP